jgi:hypothetical protein
MLSITLAALIVFWLYLEVGLRMIAYRTYFGSFLADNDVTAV